MKKLLPSLVMALCLAGIVNAQEFFFKISGGYAWPGLQNTGTILGPSINPLTPDIDALAPMANVTNINEPKDTVQKYKPVHGSYGQGGGVSLRFGYMINPYFGVDLGVAYLHGANIVSTGTYDLSQPGYPLNPFYPALSQTNLDTKITTYSYGISAMPSLTVTGAKPGFKVYPYARVGLTLPVWGKVIHNIDLSLSQSIQSGLQQILHSSPDFLGQNVTAQMQTEATVSLGVNAAIGIAYKPLPWLDAFIEVGGQYLNVKAKSTTITQWTADGANLIPARGVYRTQFNYVDELTSQSNNAQYNPNYNPNLPKDDIRPIAPFSNLGINAGLTFYLSKKIVGKNGDKKNKNK